MGIQCVECGKWEILTLSGTRSTCVIHPKTASLQVPSGRGMGGGRCVYFSGGHGGGVRYGWWVGVDGWLGMRDERCGMGTKRMVPKLASKNVVVVLGVSNAFQGASSCAYQVPQPPSSEEYRCFVSNRPENHKQESPHAREDPQARHDLSVGNVEVRARGSIFASYAT